MTLVKRLFSLVLIAAILLPTLSLFPFSLYAKAAENETLFFSSFEKNESHTLLQSTLDGNTLSSVGKYTFGSTSSNLATSVLPSSLDGTADGFSGEGKINLFDNNPNTKYCIDQTTIDTAHPITVIFALLSPAVISSYALVSANDSEPRDPKTFTLFGSTDGDAWTTLDSQTNARFSNRKTQNTYTLTKESDAFRYFKLEVYKTYGEDYTTKGTRLFQLAEIKLFGKLGEIADGSEDVIGTSLMASLRALGPIASDAALPGQGFTGDASLRVYGEQQAKTDTYARNILFRDLSIKVVENTKLSYVIYPDLTTKSYDYNYTSHHLAIDLRFSDGSYLSELACKDQNGFGVDPVSQGESEALYTSQWNYIEADLGKVAYGKTVVAILVYFKMDSTATPSRFLSYFDDIKLENRTDPDYPHLSDYVSILRGTNNTKAASRGITVPFVMRPNAFNGYTPVNTTDEMLPYYYQEGANGLSLRHITVNHSASPWLPDANFGTWQMMVNTSLTLSDAEKNKQFDPVNRAADYTHQNEIAKAHYYSVTFNEDDDRAPSVRMEITPTSHGAYLRCTYPQNAENINLILGSEHGGSITLSKQNGKTVVSGYTEHSEKMYVYAEIDAEYLGIASLNATRLLAFDKNERVITMKLATSYISIDQAKHNLALEIDGSDTFDTIFEEARDEWDELLSTVEVKGASYTERVTLYSSLYRMHCYPYLYAENTGTKDAPIWRYRSPYTDKITDGKLYTTNGFWDTYRAYWPAMSLLDAERDAELLNGLLLHYRDKGYIARWLGSKGVTCMMGTHSDVVLADAILKGLPIDLEAAIGSMLKNAATANPDNTYGRAENDVAPFIGYVPNSHENGLSWTLEDYINDYGIFRLFDYLHMNAEMRTETVEAYEALAAYYYNRCLSYADVFNTEVGYFMGKNQKGAWTKTKAEFNPYSIDWYADYAETNAWNMAFAITYDIKGLAALYGGEEKLLQKLETFFSEAREKNTYTGGYTYEQRETRLGLSMYNNQVSYHTAYLFSYLGKPSETQRLTREILSRLYVGSEIGQGYPGDEDNGASSAFYLLTALGLYEANIGSGEYIITSPLYGEYTLHLKSGDVTVIANNNSDTNLYIQSCTVNGESYDLPYFTYETLTSGDLTIVYEMGSTPKEHGGEKKDSLSSLSTNTLYHKTPYRDLLKENVRTKDQNAELLTPSTVTVYTNGITNAKALWDNTSKTAATLEKDASLTVAFPKPTRVSIITLTNAAKSKGADSITVETSKDGKTWLKTTAKVSNAYDHYTEPYLLKDCNEIYFLRVTFHADRTVTLSELEFLGEANTASTLPPITNETTTAPEVTVAPTTTKVPTTQDTPVTDTPDPTPQNPSGSIAVYILIPVAILAIGSVAAFFVIKQRKTHR